MIKNKIPLCVKKHRIICFLLSICFVCNALCINTLDVHGASNTKKIRLSEVKVMALSNSSSYRKIKSKIAAQQVKYQSAVKAIQLKKKKMSTFKWTPLLSFKFPENPTLADEYEFTFKPIQIQSQITTLKHQLSDEVYAIYEDVSNLFVQIYTLQESIAFDEKGLVQMEKTLEKNRARLLTGESTQADVDKMEASVKAITNRIATNNRSIQEKKEKLADMIQLDITTGYQFQNPYENASITRADLPKLVESALSKDQTFYEAKMATQQALIGLNTNYSLMKNQYGGKMWHIDSFIQQAKAGNVIDTDAMKSAYDKLLVDVDQPWNGNIRILFIRIPKEWFKGDTAGTRYVEDDPYALYTSILDYQEAYSDENSARKELINNVNVNFNAMITARNSYLSLKEEAEQGKDEVAKSLQLNYLGELPYAELKDIQDEYEEIQRLELEALDTYTQTLYSYDRLTCGAITALLYGTDISINPAVGGNSYLVEDTVDGASYYIRSIVEDDAFEIGVVIPEEFSIEITHFELWIDDTKVIDKTPVAQAARHMTFTKEVYDQVFIRLYNEEDFVDDCEIDPTDISGPLEITGGYHMETREEALLGTYQSVMDDNINLNRITITPQEDLNIAYYTVETSDGKKLYSKDYIPIKESFQYLSVIAGNLDDLTVKFYGENQNLLFTGYFDASNMAIKQIQE